ncbi:PEP-CTERM sorting domain-containing protein [Sphingomonas profundi]|nr:PEP-CTERM sorting domain-containing protein [Sphingomonas profundi]
MPAPPMVILFGAAAGALVLRQRLARKATTPDKG